MNNRMLLTLKGRSIEELYFYVKDIILNSGRGYSYSRNKEKKKPVSAKLIINDWVISPKTNEIRIADECCSHFFNLLGSGKKILQNNEFDRSKEFRNISCFEISSIRNEIQRLNPNYSTIEWQADFKNNYKYDVFKKSESIGISGSIGVDIKIPWELSRCQHLPFLARLYRETGEQRYRQEILCEILDFIAYNPIDYGVNWKCTMDVAIRVSNWIMALDLLGEPLDKGIDSIVSKSIYQHCVFIRFHLEDQRNYRGNHYLSDIVGLIYSSTYFKPKGRIRAFQEFAIKKLIASIDEQFYEDGGNFESSLPYHRLSLELTIYGLWRIFSLSVSNDICGRSVKELINNKRVTDKIGRACRMMIDAVRPDGDIYQLGDNDSGHLFRFFHFGEFITDAEYKVKYGRLSEDSGSVWDENELCCSEIIQIIESILGVNNEHCFFDELIRNVFQTHGINKKLKTAFEEAGQNTVKNNSIIPMNLTFKKERVIEFSSPIDTMKIRSFYYPDFGLVGLRSDDFYLGISITPVGQKGRGGHSHNDKLSYELYVNGISIESDPGTYVYTESKKWRDRFRSSVAHNSPYFGEEQNPISDNCFELRQKTECEVLVLSDRVIQASCKYGDIYVIRRFETSPEHIVITDYSNKEQENKPEFNYFSNGYGKILEKKEIL